MAGCKFFDISHIVGSIGGSTFQKTRGGIIKRSKPFPTNPNTGRQQETRAILGALSAAWSSVLTAVQRAAWDDYAETHTVPGKLGDKIALTGHQWYIRANAPLTDAGLDLIALPPVGVAPPPIVGLGVTIKTPDSIDVAFTTALEAGNVLVVWGTHPKNPGSSPNFDQASLVGYSEADAVTPVDLTSPWNLQVGQEMFIFAAQMSPEGLKSAFEVESDLAEAPI